MTRQSGQSGSEYMLVVSAVVVAVVGSAFVFVPSFRDGTRVLGTNVQNALSTGSFAGLGLSNSSGSGGSAAGSSAIGGAADAAAADDAPVGRGFGEGGDDTLNNGRSQQTVALVSDNGPAPGLVNGSPEPARPKTISADRASALEASIQQNQVKNQGSGGLPPTGIDGNICGLWALSYIMSQAGLDGGTLQTLMRMADSTDGVLLSDDYRIDQTGMKMLASALGLEHDSTTGKDFAASGAWLAKEFASGRNPAVLVHQNGRAHWMVVTGQTRDAAGNVTGYAFQDSTTSAEQTMTTTEFEQAWGAYANQGLSFGEGNPSVATK